MSDELEVIGGRASMAYRRADGAPWWEGDGKTGAHIPEDATHEDIMRLARMNYLVETVPIYVQAPDGSYTEVQGHKAIARQGDGVLGLASDKYRVIQNQRRLESMLKILGDKAKISTAGVLKDGALIWLCAQLETFRAAGDEHKCYLQLDAWHDGFHGNESAVSHIRTVCANTHRMALGSASHRTRVVHVGDVEAAQNAADDQVALALAQKGAYVEAAEAMSATPIPRSESEEIVRDLLLGRLGRDRDAEARRVEQESRELVGALLGHPGLAAGPVLSDRQEARVHDILARAQDGLGNARHRGSAWALFNGVTDHVDHTRLQGAEPERRLLYQTRGAGHDLKRTAFAYLRTRSGVKTVEVPA